MRPEGQPNKLNTLSLKILALVFGYSLWNTMSESHKTLVTLQAPLSFYHEKGKILDAPEAIAVSLSAPRKELYQLTRDIAVHINAENLKEGKNTVTLDHENLLLPESVKLITCTPSTVTIAVEKA